MNNPGMGSKSLDLGSKAVVKAHTYGNQQVAMAYGHVRIICAVHSRHAEPKRVGSRKGAQTHERRGNGTVDIFSKGSQLLPCPAEQNPASRQDQRPFGASDQRQRLHTFFFYRTYCFFAKT